MKREGITRRDLLRAGAGLAAAAALPRGAFGAASEPEEPTARVVLVRHEDAVDESGAPNGEVIQAMLDDGVAALLEESDAAAAWERLVSPDELVGIKSNVWRMLPTPPEVVDGLRKRAFEAGVPAESIRVTDRRARQMLGDRTALLNARPLRTHHWAAIGGCLKNYIIFTPRPSDYHPDTCADLGAVWNLPIVKGKTRLNVLVVLTPLFYGRGPHHFDPRYLWPYRGLLLSRDPVAVDSVGVRLLEAKRREFFNEERPLAPLAKHVRYAETRHAVGVSDPERIELIKLGWQEGILI